MKNLIKICLPALLFLALFGCRDNSPQGKELNALHDKVWEVHDEVMPKMKDMNKLSRQLKKKDPESANPAIQAMIKRLSDEDDNMMNWMRGYDKPSFKDYDKAKAYLLKEQTKVNKLRDGMLEAIKVATEMAK